MDGLRYITAYGNRIRESLVLLLYLPPPVEVYDHPPPTAEGAYRILGSDKTTTEVWKDGLWH